MAATKRNAGLTSGVPRQTLNDEELVSVASAFSRSRIVRGMDAEYHENCAFRHKSITFDMLVLKDIKIGASPIKPLWIHNLWKKGGSKSQFSLYN